MKHIHVHTTPAYTVTVGAGVLDRLMSAIGGQAAVIADANVAALHAARLARALPNAAVLPFEPGEASKSLATAGTLYDRLAELGIGRGDTIVALGGGVAGDLAGFVASTWHRGTPWINVATSLEAAVDAAVGGKTGVNHPSGKNLIGAFHQPRQVIIDLELLSTLPDREFVAALAESVKHAVIADPAFLSWQEAAADAILARDGAIVEELIARNCAIKAAIVAQDERDRSLRLQLNHGHTFGHAFEAALSYQLRHGECVALGMLAENRLSVRRGWLSADDAQRVSALLARLRLPTHLPRNLDADVVLRAMRHDKKNADRRITFALLESIGCARLAADFDDALLSEVIAQSANP